MRLLLFLAIAASLVAQETEVRNPHTTPADIEAGRKIFRSHCAECHGLEGLGGRGSNLTTGNFFHGSSDSALLKNISEGIPGTEMPGVFFSPAQVWQVVSYVRSLSAQRAAEKLTGDKAAGEKVFQAKGCANCHLVAGKGRSRGPELTYIGSQRSAAHLKEAILSPGERVDREWWTATVKTGDKSAKGFLMNEDTHSIQIWDPASGLKSLVKTPGTTVEVSKTSTMPSFEGRLSGKEVDDLVAYLASLRRPGGKQ